MPEQRPLALVTGASRGIGASIASRLAEDGYAVWLNYRGGHQAAAAVRDGIVSKGGSCTLLPFDVADGPAVEAALAPLLAEKIPDVLVNNAGFAKDGIFAMMPESDWNSVLAVHLGGFFHVTRALLPFMLRRRSGHILNIASTSGQTGVGGQVNYSAAKAGLIGATRSLAVEVGKRDVRVNALAPGFIETGMTASLPKEALLPHIPLRRFGLAEEVAAAASFLCSARASYITGQVLAMNGGLFM